MKVTFMRKICLSLLLAVVLAVSLPSAVFASEPVAAEPEDNNYIEWKLSDDGNTLEGNGRVYTYYELPIMSEIVSETRFHYGNLAKNDNLIYNVESYTRDSEIVWFGDDNYILATEKGRDHLDSFFAGQKHAYRLYCGTTEVNDIDASLIDELENAAENGADKVTVNVTNLERWNEYELLECDSDGIIGFGIGSVFKINGEFYYVNYDDLDNSYFDAFGDISFRKGSIEFVKLDGELEGKVKRAVNSMERVYFEHESEFTYTPVYKYNFPHVGIVWYGFICPIGGTVAGLVLANSKKLGKPRRWYILAAVSAAALILSVIIVATVV